MKSMCYALICVMLFSGIVFAGGKKGYDKDSVTNLENIAKSGYIDLSDAKNNRFYVHPKLWANLEYKKKQGCVLLMWNYAIYSGDGEFGVHVFDMMTHKKIAISGAFGVEIY